MLDCTRLNHVSRDSTGFVLCTSQALQMHFTCFARLCEPLRLVSFSPLMNRFVLTRCYETFQMLAFAFQSGPLCPTSLYLQKPSLQELRHAQMWRLVASADSTHSRLVSIIRVDHRLNLRRIPQRALQCLLVTSWRSLSSFPSSP